jgi:hypothetical protein
MSETGIFHGRSSIRRASARDSRAYFDALYAPVPGRVINPLTDDMNTSRPWASRI